MVFAFKLAHFIPQSDTSTPLRDPVLAISHLEKFDLRSKFFKWWENESSNFLTEAKSLLKNVESWVYAV